jgi:hypothetical protein
VTFGEGTLLRLVPFARCDAPSSRGIQGALSPMLVAHPQTVRSPLSDPSFILLLPRVRTGQRPVPFPLPLNRPVGHHAPAAGGPLLPFQPSAIRHTNLRTSSDARPGI